MEFEKCIIMRVFTDSIIFAVSVPYGNSSVFYYEIATMYFLDESTL